MNRDESMSADEVMREACALALRTDRDIFRDELDVFTEDGLWCPVCLLPSALRVESRVYFVTPERVSVVVKNEGVECADCGEFVGSRNA